MINKNPKWLDRNLAVPAPFLTLCLTVEQWRKAIKNTGIDPQTPMFGNGYSDATTTILSNNDGDLMALVAVRTPSKLKPIEIACLLVHEAVHIWQEYCDNIGEHKPGSEQEAYAIQLLSKELMQEYVRLTKEVKKKNGKANKSKT